RLHSRGSVYWRCSFSPRRAYLPGHGLGRVESGNGKAESGKWKVESGKWKRKASAIKLWLELLREECGIDCSLTTPIEQEAGELIAILRRSSGARERSRKWNFKSPLFNFQLSKSQLFFNEHCR